MFRSSLMRMGTPNSDIGPASVARRPPPSATIANALEALTASQSLAGRGEPTCKPVAGYDGAVTERAEGVGMTGTHDHLAEQGRIPDQARPHTGGQPSRQPSALGRLTGPLGTVAT